MSRESWCPNIRENTGASHFSSNVIGNGPIAKQGRDDSVSSEEKHVDCNRGAIPRRGYDDTFMVVDGVSQQPPGSNGEPLGPAASSAQQAACASFFSGQLANTATNDKYVGSFKGASSSVPYTGFTTSISSAAEHPSAPGAAPMLSAQTKQLLGMASGGESGSVSGATALAAQNAAINAAHAAAARAESEVVLGPACLVAGVSASKGLRNSGPLEASTAVLSAAGSYVHKEYHIFNPQSIPAADRQAAEEGGHLYEDDVIAYRHALGTLQPADSNVVLNISHGVSSADDEGELMSFGGSSSPTRNADRKSSTNKKKGIKKGAQLGGNADFAFSFRPAEDGVVGSGDDGAGHQEDVMVLGEASFSTFAIKDPRFHDSPSPASNHNNKASAGAGITTPKDVSVKSLEHLLRLLIVKRPDHATTDTGSDENTAVGVPIKHLSLSGSNGAEVPAWALSLLLGTKLLEKEVPTQNGCDKATTDVSVTDNIVAEGAPLETGMSTPTKARTGGGANSLTLNSPPAGSARSAVIMNYRVTKETLSSIAQQEQDRSNLVATLEHSIQHLLHDSLVSLDLSNGVLEPTYAPIDKRLKALSFAQQGRTDEVNGGEDVEEDDVGTSPSKKRGARKSEAQKAIERAHLETLKLSKREKNFYLEQLLNRDVPSRTAAAAAAAGSGRPVGDEVTIDADDDEEALARLLDGEIIEAETEQQERDAAQFEDEAVSTAALIILRDALLPFSARVPVEMGEVSDAIVAMVKERKDKKLRARRERRREALKDQLREQGDNDRDEVAAYDTGDVGAVAPDFNEDLSADAEVEEREVGDGDDDDEDDDGGSKRKRDGGNKDANDDNEDEDNGADEEDEEDNAEDDTDFERRKVALFKKMERTRMFVPPVLQRLQNLNLSNNPSLFLDQVTATSASRIGSTRGFFSIADAGSSLATTATVATAAASRAATLAGGRGEVVAYDGAAAAELGSSLVAIEALRTLLLLSSHEYKYRHCFKTFWEEVNKQAMRCSPTSAASAAVDAVPKALWYHRNNLRTLLLSNTGLGTPAAIKALAQGLKYNTSLHTLDLSRNALGGNFGLAKNAGGGDDDGGDGVTENHAEKEEAFIGSFANRALRCNKHLKVLDLSENGLSGKMVAALALALGNSIHSFRPKPVYPDAEPEDEEDAALQRIGDDEEDEQTAGGEAAEDDESQGVDADGNPKNEVKFYNLKDFYNPDPYVLFSSDEEESDEGIVVDTSPLINEDPETARRNRRWAKKYPHLFNINEWSGLDLGEAEEKEEAERFAEFVKERDRAQKAADGVIGEAEADDDDEARDTNNREAEAGESAVSVGDNGHRKRRLEPIVLALFDETYFPSVADRPKMPAVLPPVTSEDEEDDDEDLDEDEPKEEDDDEEGNGETKEEGEEDEEEDDEKANKKDAEPEEEEAEEIPEEDEETKLRRLEKEHRRDERVWKKKMRYFVWIPEQIHLIYNETVARRNELLKDYKVQLTLLKVQELFEKRNYVLKLEARRVDAEIRRSKLGWSELQLLSLQRNPAVGDRGAIALAKALRHSIPVSSEQERLHEQRKRVALLKYIIQCVVAAEQREIRKEVSRQVCSPQGLTDDVHADATAADLDAALAQNSTAVAHEDTLPAATKPAIPPLASGRRLEDVVSKHRTPNGEDADEEGEEEEDEEGEAPQQEPFDDDEDGNANDEGEEATRRPAAPKIVETEEPLALASDASLTYFQREIPVSDLVHEEIERYGLASLLLPIPEGLLSSLVASLYVGPQAEKQHAVEADEEDDEDEAPFSDPKPDVDEEVEEEDADEGKAEANRQAALDRKMAKLPYGDRTATKPGFRSLQHLNLEGCGIGSAGIKSLSETIADNCPSLRTLNLAQNNRFAIRRKRKTQEEKDAEEALLAEDEAAANGDEDEVKRLQQMRKGALSHGAKYDLAFVSPAVVTLAKALSTNTTLVTLDLSFCRLYPAALLGLAVGFQSNRTLKHLNLRGNFFGVVENFTGPAHIKGDPNARIYSPLAYFLASIVEEDTNGPCSLETLILDGNSLGAPEVSTLVTKNNPDFEVVGTQESTVFDMERGEYHASVVEEVLAQKETLKAFDDAAATLLAHLCHASLSTLSIANNNLSNEDLARLSNGVFEQAMDKKVGGGEGSAISVLVNELLGITKREVPENQKRMGPKRSSITDLVDEETNNAVEPTTTFPKEESEEESSDVEESRMLAFKKKVAGPGANAGGKPLRAAGASFCVNTTATLQVLNVGFNTRLVGEAGATCVARMIQFMSRLEELYIDGCHGLGDKGFELICLKIRSHTALKVLSVPRTGITTLAPLVTALKIKLGQMRDGTDKKPMALAVLDISDNDLNPSSIDEFSKVVVEGKRIQVVATAAPASPMGASSFVGRGFGGANSLRGGSESATFGRLKSGLAFVETSDTQVKPQHQVSEQNSDDEDEDDDDYCPPPCADPYGEEDVTPSVALERQASRAVLASSQRHRSDDDEEDAPSSNARNNAVESPLPRSSPSPVPAEGKVTGLSLVPMLRYIAIWGRRGPSDAAAAQQLHSSLLFAVRRLVDEGFLDDFCVPTLSSSLQTFFTPPKAGDTQQSIITTSLTNLLRSHGKPLVYAPPILSSTAPSTSPTDSNSSSSSIGHSIHAALVAAERSLDMSAACAVSMLSLLEQPGCVSTGDYIPIPDPDNLRPALAQAASAGGYIHGLMRRVEVNQVLRRRLRRLRLKRRAQQENLGERSSLVPTFLQLFTEEQSKLTKAITELSSLASIGASSSDAAAISAAFNISKILKSILAKQHAAIAYYATEFKISNKREMGHQYIAAFPESQPNAAELTTMPYPPPAHAARSAKAGFSLTTDSAVKALNQDYPLVYRDGVLVVGVAKKASTNANLAGDGDEEEDGAIGDAADENEEEAPTYVPLEEDAVIDITDPFEESAMNSLSRRLKAAIKQASLVATTNATTHQEGLPNFKLPPTTHEMDVRATAVASFGSAVTLGGLLGLLIPNRFATANAGDGSNIITETCPLNEMEWACLRNRLL